MSRGLVVDGDDVLDLADALGQVGHAIATDLDQANQAAADDVLGQVRKTLPRRTGNLADSTRAEASALGFTITAGGSQAPYAPCVAPPYLADAEPAAREAAETAVVDRLTTTIKEKLT